MRRRRQMRDKLGAEVAPPSAPPTDTFWTPQLPDAGATRTALAAQGGVEPPWAHRLFIAVCDGGSATRRKGIGCEDLRTRAEATEARDASNGASQRFVTSVTRRLWANSLTVSGQQLGIIFSGGQSGWPDLGLCLRLLELRIQGSELKELWVEGWEFKVEG